MKPKNAVMLLLTSLIWGTAFVAQSVGMDFLEPFTFNGVRSFIGGVTLLPGIWLLEKMNGKPEVDGTRKDLIQGGIACGLLLFAASSLQQMGIQYTTAGKAGFITAFYIVFVPVLGIFLKKAAGWKVWMSVFLALIGLYFLCIKEGFSIGKGDIMIFACALVFAVHILVIDYYSPKVDGVKMSCIQFFVCGIASLPFMFLTETPQIGDILDARMPILYAGVMSSGVGYTLQILGQKTAPPALASILMSMESVFAALAGWVILGERLSAVELCGCGVVFACVVLAQLGAAKPPKKQTQN